LLRVSVDIDGRIAQGKYDEAMPLSEQSLKTSEMARGTTVHLDVAASLQNLATLKQSQVCIVESFLLNQHRAQGKYDEAMPLYERSLETLKKDLGPDHPDVATSLSGLALLLKTQVGC